MKESEIKLEDEGFEEVRSEERSNEGSTGGAAAPGGSTGSNRPDLRVVQADRDKNGNVMYKNVGGMWKNISKNGNEFYTLKIGELKLLVFPNANK